MLNLHFNSALTLTVEEETNSQKSWAKGTRKVTVPFSCLCWGTGTPRANSLPVVVTLCGVTM